MVDICQTTVYDVRRWTKGILMAGSRISIRISRNLRHRLEEEASLNGKRESDVVREALQRHLGRPRRETCHDLARRLGLIGCVKKAPPDLSTNRKYFEGFGRD